MRIVKGATLNACIASDTKITASVLSQSESDSFWNLQEYLKKLRINLIYYRTLLYFGIIMGLDVWVQEREQCTDLSRSEYWANELLWQKKKYSTLDLLKCITLQQQHAGICCSSKWIQYELFLKWYQRPYEQAHSFHSPWGLQRHHFFLMVCVFLCVYEA